MLLNPVKQCQLILCQLRQDRRLVVAFSKFRFHLFHDLRDTGIAFMLVERLEQIQLGVLFDLHAQVVQLLDRCVTSQEVKRSGTEGNDL